MLPDAPKIATVGSAPTLYRVLCTPCVFSSSRWSCEVALSSPPFCKSGNLGLSGVCGSFRVLQSDSGRGGTGRQARRGHTSPPPSGYELCPHWEGLLGFGRDGPSPLASWVLPLCSASFGGSRQGSQWNQICSLDFNLSRQCWLAIILR